jgi:hypothetical protein
MASLNMRPYVRRKLNVVDVNVIYPSGQVNLKPSSESGSLDAWQVALRTDVDISPGVKLAFDDRLPPRPTESYACRAPEYRRSCKV